MAELSPLFFGRERGAKVSRRRQSPFRRCSTTGWVETHDEFESSTDDLSEAHLILLGQAFRFRVEKVGDLNLRFYHDGFLPAAFLRVNHHPGASLRLRFVPPT